VEGLQGGDGLLRLLAPGAAGRATRSPLRTIGSINRALSCGSSPVRDLKPCVSMPEGPASCTSALTRIAGEGSASRSKRSRAPGVERRSFGGRLCRTVPPPMVIGGE